MERNVKLYIHENRPGAFVRLQDIAASLRQPIPKENLYVYSRTSQGSLRSTEVCDKTCTIFASASWLKQHRPEVSKLLT